MQYQKKMCVLRQLKQGFSGDGRPLSGLIKVEQYGKNLSVEVSVIGFAPLSSGEYYCLIADGKKRTELLPLRGKTTFNLVSELEIESGFCGVICFIKTEILPIACGINGNLSFDIKTLTEKAFLSRTKGVKPVPAPSKPIEPAEVEEETAPTYDDEVIAEKNYFEGEREDERSTVEKDSSDVSAESGVSLQAEQTGDGTEKDADGEDVLHAFTTDSDGFYREIKEELDELFSRYPKDESLSHAFSHGEWVRVKGTAEAPEQLVGVVYENGKAKYICYAVPARDKNAPPEELKGAGFFIPASPFNTDEGFFVLYQSAATGESILPQKE